MRDLEGLRAEARALLNEPDEDLFLDSELNNWLNEGCVHFSIESQCLEVPFTLLTSAGIREYALPINEGDVKDVIYYDGATNWQLVPSDAKYCMPNTFFKSSSPQWYYVRINTNLLGIQSQTDSSISYQLIGNASPSDFKNVLVIHPAPDADGRIVTVVCYIEHPLMKRDRDKCLIPWRYRSAPVYWACMKAYKKEKSYAEAKDYEQQFADLLQKAQDRKAFEGRTGHPVMKRDKDVEVDGAFPEKRWLID